MDDAKQVPGVPQDLATLIRHYIATNQESKTAKLFGWLRATMRTEGLEDSFHYGAIALTSGLLSARQHFIEEGSAVEAAYCQVRIAELRGMMDEQVAWLKEQGVEGEA